MHLGSDYDLLESGNELRNGYGFVSLQDSDFCFIDDQSIKTLELVENNIDPSNKRQTLFGYLSVNTSTTIGQRLLREVIQRPLCHPLTIESRLDCIEYLVERVDTLAMINSNIKKFGNGIDLDNLHSTLINLCKDRRHSTAIAEKKLEVISILEKMVGQVDNLSANLKNVDQPFLELCHSHLDDPAYNEIREEISRNLCPEIRAPRGKRMRIFRIKDEVDHLFDLARGSYFAAINDIESYESDLQRETGLAWRVCSTEARGYYLSIHPTKIPKKYKLNSLYLNVSKNRYVVTCTTKELMRLNVRANISYENSMTLANDILSECLSSVMRHIGAINKLVELIGAIDLTTSLAMLVANSNEKLVRPKFTPHATIIEGGRHPVMESILEGNKLNFVDNDSRFQTKTNNFMLVTGPNMGGKTIYLKQVALIQIMAQIGCYVPARSAHIKLVNRIVARSGMNNDNWSNCSSFMWEMKGIATALTESTQYDNTLYLIDEIGRGTSIDCGASYSFAISEELSLRENSFTLFATHFDQVLSLSNIYKNIVPYHFEYETQEGPDGSTIGYKTNHKLVPGEAEKVNYGIRLAESCGFPAEIIQLACQGFSEYRQDRCSGSMSTDLSTHLID